MKQTSKQLLTAVELAEALAVSLSTIRRMTRDGLPVIRVRSLVRYDFDDVLVSLARRGRGSQDHAKRALGAV